MVAVAVAVALAVAVMLLAGFGLGLVLLLGGCMASLFFCLLLLSTPKCGVYPQLKTSGFWIAGLGFRADQPQT